MKIGISDISYCEPDKFVTSDDIEKDLSRIYEKLKLPFGRIEMQTGIKSRGVYPNKLPSEIASLAAKKLFAKEKIKTEEIDLLIHASVCRDFLEPSTASVVHNNLKLRSTCLSFDLSNACLGVISAIQVASDMITAGSIKKALIVTGENSYPLLTKTIDTLLNDSSITRKSIKKYFANFTIGSAGVALVIEKNSPKCLGTIDNIISLSDTSAYKLCMGNSSGDGLVMETNSEELMQKGIELAKENWSFFKNQAFNYYICHQVGIHHQELLYKSLELDLSKDYASFERYGNTGSAALPLTLALAVKNEIFNTNDKIALLGIGSGLHTTMMSIKWN